MSAAPELAGCDHYGLVSIHHSARGIVRRITIGCPTCERRTPAVLKWDGAYYGTTTYCIVCLDGWMDGERMGRPFRRYWKRERGAYVRELWDGAMLPDLYRAWMRWDIHRATCDVYDPDERCVECETRPS